MIARAKTQTRRELGLGFEYIAAIQRYQMLTCFYRFGRKLERIVAMRDETRRRRREIEGWKRMLRACHEWADKIGHAESRRALLSMAENYRNAIDAQTRDDPTRDRSGGGHGQDPSA